MSGACVADSRLFGFLGLFSCSQAPAWEHNWPWTVARGYPDLVQYDNKREMETVSYNFVNAMLLNEVQKQHRTIENQKEQINSLEERLARLEVLLIGR